MNDTLKTHILTKEEFLDRVLRNRGSIDLIDCFYMAHFYTEEFGDLETTLPREVEMFYMFRRLIGKPVLEEDLYDPKTIECRECKRHHPVTFYSINQNASNGRLRICRFCDSSRPNAYEQYQKLENKTHKFCRNCKEHKKNIDFSLSKSKSLFDKTGICNECRKYE